MRTALLIALVFIVSANARLSMTSLMQLRTEANDAIDAGLDVIRGLKQENIDSQRVADEINKTKEKELGSQIADMTYICDTNKDNGDASTEHRKFLENEIDVTVQYLNWIVKRREELTRKKSELEDQRCTASMMFVKALKQHDEALEVVRMLKADVVEIVEEKTGEHVELIQEGMSRLGMYASLFNAKAVNEFNQLSQEAVDQESLEHDNRSDDNSREALSLDMGTDNKDQRNIGQRFVDMINKLEAHLIASMEDLKVNEINAAWNLVEWLQDAEEEHIHLNDEQVAKTTYIDKLTINIVGAKAHEERMWEIYFASAEALNDTIADRVLVRQAYIEEKMRRDEENLILEECIQIYIKQVSVLDDKIRAGSTDLADDGVANYSNGNYDNDRVDAMA